MRIFVLLFFVVTVGFWKNPNVVYAWCQATTDPGAPLDALGCPEGIGVHWKRPCISFSVDERGIDEGLISFDEISQISQRAFDSWTNLTCLNEPLELRTQKTGPSLCRTAEYNFEVGNVNTIAFPPEWDTRKFSPQALGATVIFFNAETGEIFDGDILINTTAGDLQICPLGGCRTNDEDRQVDLENVLAHEVGHFFGLAHSTDSQATMFGSSPPGEVSKRTLSLDDKIGMCQLYPEDTFIRECDFDPENGLDLDCETKSSAGCQIGFFHSRKKMVHSIFLFLLGSLFCRNVFSNKYLK